MRFAITGTDPRFTRLRELLEQDGHAVVPPEQAEMVIPPPWDGAARYARQETYLIENAALTAQGAAALLGRELTLSGAAVLVLGYGRVGALTARALREAGAAVTVYARRSESRAWARAEGCRAVDEAELDGVLPHAKAVVNTIPAPVLTAERVALCPKEAVLLELASSPGGIDQRSAEALGRTYRRAPGLPGRFAPDRAAAILRDAVYAAAAEPMPRLGVAVTGSHCTFDKALAALAPLRETWTLVPILSAAAAATDTRFAAAAEFRGKLEALCGRKAVDTIAGAEPLGTAEALDALLVVPCTGNTLGKLAHGITDTAVTMACKAHLRNSRPLVLAISTNDGLSGSLGSIAALMQRKNVYFVPFRQDDPKAKPWSLQSELGLLAETVDAAVKGVQYQPVLL